MYKSDFTAIKGTYELELKIYNSTRKNSAMSIQTFPSFILVSGESIGYLKKKQNPIAWKFLGILSL